MMEVLWKGQDLKPGKLFIVQRFISGHDNHMLWDPKEKHWMSFEQTEILMYAGCQDTPHAIKMFNRFKSVTVVFLYGEKLLYKSVGGIHNYPVELDVEPEFRYFIEKLNK